MILQIETKQLRAYPTHQAVHSIGSTAKIEVFYFPVYCPELSPDDYLNNDLKSALYGAEAVRMRPQVTKKAVRYLRPLQKQPQRVQKFFKDPKVADAA